MADEQLTQPIAEQILDSIGSSGQPPNYGFQFFTAGIDDYLSVIEHEFLEKKIKRGDKALKMVVAGYGSGKTHFLYCVREIAFKHNYVVSYVSLTHDATPFHDKSAVYKAVISNMLYPMEPEELMSGYELGIENFIKTWYANKLNEFKINSSNPGEIEERLEEYMGYLNQHNYENTSFSNAVREAFLALKDRRDSDFSLIMQWLKAEGIMTGAKGHNRFGILQPIDKKNAFDMLRSLIQWIKDIGYTGMILLFDEVEQRASLGSQQHRNLLGNLKELVDECSLGKIKSTMFFYAVPDTNFLTGNTGTHVALNQRLAGTFVPFDDHFGQKIFLENVTGTSKSIMLEIGIKLSHIYEIAYEVRFDVVIIEEAVGNIVDSTVEAKFAAAGTLRLLVQSLVRAFQYLQKKDGMRLDKAQSDEIVQKMARTESTGE